MTLGSQQVCLSNAQKSSRHGKSRKKKTSRKTKRKREPREEVLQSQVAESYLCLERKRSRSVRSDNESVSGKGSITGRKRKKSKTERSNASSKRQPVVEPDDEESDASGGTDDSYMNELKSKNDGTYPWEDVRRQREDARRQRGDEPRRQVSSNDSMEEDSQNEYASLKEEERQRRKSKRKLESPTKGSKKHIPAKNNPPAKKSTSSTSAPMAPHFPFGSRSMNSIKPARRKPVDSVNTHQPDERFKNRPLSLSHRNNIKKRQGQEPPPDATAISVFRPDAVLTNAARTMKSGRGYEKAIGDIDTAISISQASGFGDQKTEPPKPVIAEKAPESPKQRSRKSSVTDAISNALKFRDNNRSKTVDTSPVIRSPVSPVRTFPEPIEEEPDTNASANAQPNNAPVPARSPIRRTSYSADSSKLPEQQLPPPRKNSGSYIIPRIIPTSDIVQPPQSDILPTLAEDASRTWTGELLFSKELASLGQVRLFIPQSSIRIKQLPKLGSSIWLTKMLSAQYLSTRWFSKTAHPNKKPECLLVEFLNKDAEKTLVDALRNTDSAGLVCEETFTLLFFFKHNERLRMLFNGNASSGPVGVALLDGVNIEAPAAQVSKADEVIRFAKHRTNLKVLHCRRLPYNAILVSSSFDSLIPRCRDKPYAIHSPAESLETQEMEAILATRGLVPSPVREEARIVLIHRSYLHCLNYIPDLSEQKRRYDTEILVFGTYLDYEMEDCQVKSAFGSDVLKIFPNSGRICFTVDHLLENPQHIKSILAYNVLPRMMTLILENSAFV